MKPCGFLFLALCATAFGHDRTIQVEVTFMPDPMADINAKLDRADRIRQETLAKLDAEEARRAARQPSAAQSVSYVATPRPSQGGTITASGKTVRYRQDTPPEGFVWLFSDPTDFRLAASDPADLTDEQWTARTIESARRAKRMYSFLEDKDGPRRKVFEKFVEEHSTAQQYATLFSLSCWPELAADECARIYQWRP